MIKRYIDLIFNQGHYQPPWYTIFYITAYWLQQLCETAPRLKYLSVKFSTTNASGNRIHTMGNSCLSACCYNHYVKICLAFPGKWKIQTFTEARLTIVTECYLLNIIFGHDGAQKHLINISAITLYPHLFFIQRLAEKSH